MLILIIKNLISIKAIAALAWEWTDYYCDSDSYAICKIPGKHKI